MYISGYIVDNNVRYVALQNLGQLVSSNFKPVANNVDVLLHCLEDVFLDRDGSIILHSLRFFRLLAKHEPNDKKTPLLRFWLAFLKPKVFQVVEERSEQSLKAALCDCLSAIGEHIYQQLPVEKRTNDSKQSWRQQLDNEHLMGEYFIRSHI
jgi:hypothetical protein